MFRLSSLAMVTVMLMPAWVLAASVDPTRPPAELTLPKADAASPAGEALRLQGIKTQGNARQAMINGRLVGRGDRVGKARVTRIEAGAVELELDGRTERLLLGQPLTKQWKKQD